MLIDGDAKLGNIEIGERKKIVDCDIDAKSILRQLKPFNIFFSDCSGLTSPTLIILNYGIVCFYTLSIVLNTVNT